MIGKMAVIERGGEVPMLDDESVMVSHSSPTLFVQCSWDPSATFQIHGGEPAST